MGDLGRCVFVGDAGMVSEKNLKALSGSGGRYLLCMPIHAGEEIDEAVLSRPGRYRVAAENLRVKRSWSARVSAGAVMSSGTTRKKKPVKGSIAHACSPSFRPSFRRCAIRGSSHQAIQPVKVGCWT